MKDLHSNIKVVQALAPAVHTTLQTSATIDLQGFNSAEIVLTTGAVVGAEGVASLTESDAASSGFTTVAATDLIGTFPAGIEADSVVKVGYKGTKRYLRAALTKAGTSSATGIVAVLGHPGDAPVA